jgi:3,4-dihydroxy 2-butanone 4-phosphate synthase/GTP cyclohydrolase II
MSERKRLAEARMPTEWGEFTLIAFGEEGMPEPHVALIRPQQPEGEPVQVRIHSECMTGDTFGSTRCDCGAQLHAALEAIGREGGVLVYLRQEGRGIGLVEKLKAYALQDTGLDTVEANVALGHAIDARSYADAVWILEELGLKEVRLWTNNPEKVAALQCAGIRVEVQDISLPPGPENARYLQTKRDVLGHWLRSFPIA